MSDTIKKVIRLDMDIESLRNSAETARKLMENMENSGKPPQKLISSFEKVDKILSKIEARTKDGIFRGTDAEYNTLQSELSSIGEEFEFIQDVITKIGAMDDDALSKFLTKEDIQIFNKATKALKQYQSTLKSLETNGSSVLVKAKEKHKNVETKLNIAKEKQSYRGGVVEEKTQALTNKGYFAGKETVSQANTNLKNKQSELAAAQQKEKESKTAITSIDNEIKAIEARMEEEKTALEEQFKELKNARAAFARIQKFYETPDENGNARDTNVDYGDKSYQRAQERVRAAEAGVQSYTNLKNERQGKLQEKTTATGKLSEASKEVKALTAEVNKSNQVYQEALRNQEELEDSLKDTIKEWKEAKEIYNDVTSEVEKLTRAEEDSQRAIANAEANEEAYKKADLIAAYEKLCQEAEEMGIELNSLGISMEYSEESEEKLTQAILKRKKAMVDGIRITEGSEEAFEKLDDALIDNRENLEKSRKAQAEYNEELKQSEAFEAKIKQFLGMAGAVELLRKALVSAFQTTKELDSVMTEMAVVTDLEIGDYWKQLPEHTSRAKELGVSIKSVYEAETLYYQQGLKTNEVVALSNQTLKMAKIAGLSAADATDKMTAALRGFNMELNETSAQNVADVYSELAAITAADVNEISSAMSKTASIASSAGMEFETTAAFLSQIIETTRESAETAGTALKTVIARFQELKKDPAEIGEVDGEIVDANAIEGALRKVGVSLRDTSGQFRDLDDVFLELAQKWNTLDTNTQRYIATIAAGSRQQSRFIAMMSDYGRTQELVAAANNSAGASNEQFAKTAESLEFKLEQLKASWDEFSTGILESDLVKSGVDVLNKFLEIINKATEGINGFGGTLMKVLSTVMLFKLGAKLFEKIKQPIKAFFVDVVKEMYVAGKQSAESFEKGATSTKTNSSKEKPKTKNAPDTPDTTNITEGLNTTEGSKKGNVLVNKINSLKKDSATRQEERIKRTILKSQIQSTSEKAEVVKLKGWDENGNEKAGKEAQAARQQYKDLNKELADYNKQTEESKKKSQEAWKSTSDALTGAGTAIAGVGVGISMVGGLLSSIGLEDMGNVITIIGTAISMVGSALMAIPPILTVIAAHPVIAIITAIVALVTGLVAAIMYFEQANSYAAKLENAKKNLAAAKEVASKANEEFDKLLQARSEYDELQKQLKGLTKGTDEWRQALRESNEQVLTLLDTYPKLAEYVTRGSEGQLEISDVGWNELINTQKQAVQTASIQVLFSQMRLKDVEMEEVTKDYTNKSRVQPMVLQDGETSSEAQDRTSKELRSRLEKTYLTKGETLDSEEAEEIASELSISVTSIKEAAEALEDSADSIKQISEESETVAQNYLTAMAPDSVVNSDFGQVVTEAFANSFNSDYTQDQIDKMINAYNEGSDFKDNDQFVELAEKYGVDSKQLNNDNSHDLKVVYAAMMNLSSIEDIPAEIAEDEEQLLRAIVEGDVGNTLIENMEDYTKRLEKLALSNQEEAQNIGGMLSNEGLGMTKEFAEGLLKEGADGSQEVDTEKLEEYAKKQGYANREELATKLGKTLEEYENEIEENAKANISINEKIFKNLTNALGKSVDSFGNKVKISTQNSTALVDQVVNSIGTIGKAEGNALYDILSNVLSSAQGDADKLAEILGQMNWNSAEEWAKLPELLDASGISVDNKALEEFIQKMDDLGLSIEKVDFEAFTKKVQGLYDTLKALSSGEQGRIFEEDSYNQLIEANKELSDSFVRIGDQFYYLGSSMKDLMSTLRVSAAVEAEKNVYMSNAQKSISDSIVKFDKQRQGQFSLGDGDSAEWERGEMVDYIESYLDYVKDTDMNLSFLTDKEGNSVGLKQDANVHQFSDEKLTKIVAAISDFKNNNEEIGKENVKAVQDSSIATKALLDVNSNISKAQTLRESGSDEDKSKAYEYARAISIQATESGLVAEAVLSEYNQLMEEDTSSQKVQDRMKVLEETMKNGIKRNQALLEKLTEVNDLTNQVLEAQISTRQHEIDKLSEINESIKTANDQMINKIQEQINEERQQRENDKKMDALADKQSQFTYLMGSSNGANQLQALTLQQQIQEDQQNLEDTLIDQSLQNLTDANAAAAEQRERQIEMMQASLDYEIESGALAREAEAAVLESLQQINGGMDPLKTEIYSILERAAAIEGNMVTANQQEAFESESQAMLTNAANSLGEIQNSGATQDNQLEETKVTEQINEWLETQTTAAKTEEDEKDNRTDAIAAGAKALQSGDTAEYEKQKVNYVANGGRGEDFGSMVKYHYRNAPGSYKYVNEQGEIDTGYIATITNSGYLSDGYHWADFYYDGTNYTVARGYGDNGLITNSVSRELDERFGEDFRMKGGKVVLYKGGLYMSFGKGWYKVPTSSTEGPKDADKASAATSAIAAAKKRFNAYKDGGLADFTGPAWLDGTKAHPEMVLNAKDTANFIQLKDILAEILDSSGKISNSESKNQTSSNSYDIDITVESIGSDYDVEQMANKIRSMLYEDAMYRNTNSVSLTR